MGKLTAIGEYAIKLAEDLGASEAEAYLSQIIERKLAFHRQIESSESSMLTGIGIRTIVGKRIGFFSTSSVRKEHVEKAVETSLKIAKASEEDPEWKSLPTNYGRKPVEKVVDEKVANATPRRLVEVASKAIETVHRRDQRLTVTRGYIAAVASRHAIVNSYGCKLERNETLAWSWLAVKAEDAGLKAVCHEMAQARLWDQIDTIKMALEASDRALKMIGAKPIPNAKMPVVWKNDAFAAVVDVMLARTLTADAVQKKRSPWLGKLGQEVATESFRIVDEGLRPAGVGTRAFDDDGSPQQNTPIIEGGVLKSYLYDTYTANKEDRPSTGNARRDVGGFAAPPNYARAPIPLPNNLVLQPGDAKPEEMVKETGDGLYVIETIGEWMSNPISGELSATVANGFLIKNGELAEPVKGIIVSGNFFEVMKNGIDLIGNDLINFGRTYAPTVRLKEMTIAGE